MEFYTLKEVQEILKIGSTSAYALVQRKDFPSMKIAGSYKIPKDEFEKWCQKQMNKE